MQALPPEFARWMHATMGRLIAERKKRGLSQEALAELVGVSQTQVSAIERARNTTLGHLYKVARALEMDIAVVPKHRARALEEGTRMNIFVFGSNTAGRHGKGAALYAKQNHGAIYGQGEGLQGASYAIPTKDGELRTLPLEQIAQAVVRFKEFAAGHPELQFEVTAIGCGLAGYTPAQIAPLFAGCPENCLLPGGFTEVLAAMKGH